MPNVDLIFSRSSQWSCAAPSLIAAVLLGLTAGSATAGPLVDEMRRNMAPTQPAKAVDYRAAGDEVVRMESVYFAPPSTTHDRAAYHGNRLTQFRYLGPRHTGGLYDAIEIEREDRQLEPRKYRYHWGRWP